MYRRWSKERVVAAIRTRQAQGLSIRGTWREDQRLYNAAIRFCGSWRDALLAAGMEATPRKWTAQGVLDAILARQRAGLPLHGIAKNDPELYAVAFRRFGSWRKALLAVDLPANPRHYWTREQVIAAIQDRVQQGLPLAGFGRTVRSLGYFARQHFGSWRKAVAAAGIPDGAEHKWDKPRVIEALRACAKPGQPLTKSQTSASVRGAAFYHFGTWASALAAAGLVPLRPLPRKQWNKAAVLAEIRARWQKGAPLTVAANPNLAAAARKRFGSWHAALAEAGYRPKPPSPWSKERVLEEIQAWHAQGAFAESDAIDDRELVSAAQSRFRSWHRALVAAGVRAPGEKRKPQLKWTAQRIIEAIQDRHVRGLPLIGLRAPQLASAAARRFGGWHAALEAAGISTVKRPRPQRTWTSQLVIQEIQAYYGR